MRRSDSAIAVAEYCRGRIRADTAAEHRDNALTAAEYDETTWAARTWLSFVQQRVSVAVHKAVAREVSDALGLSAAVDPRGAPRE